jgi:hypothetical protein
MASKHSVFYQEQMYMGIFNGRACFKKCKQLFEWQHLLLLRDILGQSYNPYLNVVQVYNTSVNGTAHLCVVLT